MNRNVNVNVEKAYKGMVDAAISNPEMFEKDKDYIEAEKEYKQCFKKIMDIIPVDQQELLDELDTAVNYVEAMSQRITYEKGLKDSADMLKLLKVI